MVLFIVLVAVVLLTFIVLGTLFYTLGREEKAVPLTDLKKIKEEFSVSGANEVIPAFVPKETVSLADPMPQEPLAAEQGSDKQSSSEEDTFKKRVQELEEEIQAINKKAEEQSDVTREMIMNLTKENQSLKNEQAGAEDFQTKLAELEGEVSNLKIENANLQNQLEPANAKVTQLQEELAQAQAQPTVPEPAQPEPDEALQVELGSLKAENLELKQKYDDIQKAHEELKALNAQPPAQPVPEEALQVELGSLKAQNLELKQKYDDIQKAHEELKALDKQQAEKNEQMQYELIKARAQTSGLERVSFNYKNQLEDFLKKVNAAQAANEHLSQTKNRLEGVLQEVKLQNEELSHKDQLAQFELEKNRSRLLALEREHQELKSRIQQQNQ